MRSSLLISLLSAVVAGGAFQSAHGAIVTEVLFKLSDGATSPNKLDALSGWTQSGGFNQGVAGAESLINNGLDYKSADVDAWPISDWLSIRVSMYTDGVEQVFIEFDPNGTTKSDFFALGNVTDSSWTDLFTSGHNFFSITGDSNFARRWFVNTSYGGCDNDFGHMVVLEPGATCSWEDAARGTNSRGFWYADADSNQNYVSGSGAVADVFAVTVQRERAVVPEPTSLLLLGIGIAGLRWNQKKRRETRLDSFSVKAGR